MLVLAAGASLAHAQGGPPFITDDPGTPGNKHWEINLGWIGDHNPAHASYQLPDIDMNYGWGDRIQLKYELPLAAATDQNNTTRAGLGESLLGVKWRPYEHHTAGEPKSDENMNFSLGTYPQASINNPTSAVRRGVVETGRSITCPMEVTAKVGPIDFNGEMGRWFGNQHRAQPLGPRADCRARVQRPHLSFTAKSTTCRTPTALAAHPSSAS